MKGRHAFIAVLAGASLGTIPTAALAVERGVNAHPPIHARPLATTSPTGYSPGQIRHAYGFDQLIATGAGQTVAIVDAFDDPTAAVDLQTFITTFSSPTMHGLSATDPCTVAGGLHPCFQKVFAQNHARTESSWALEISLDVQWAHAVAPGADILLVESRDNRLGNLLGAVTVAVNDGAKAVSMSWGAGEFLGENYYDSYFNHTGVTFLAASGDSGNGILWPAVAPDVVAAGGTTLPLDTNGNLTTAETAWSGSGGGISAVEAEPSYQSSYPIPSTNGKRGVPDVSYDADPVTGVSVYDSTPYNNQIGWWQVGGTSASAPQWAGLVALADQSRSTSLSSNDLNSSPEYNAAASAVYTSNYRDVTSGSNGSCGSVCTATPGYDFVTGLGSPLANNLVPYLATH